jgi:hypothetical protein
MEMRKKIAAQRRPGSGNQFVLNQNIVHTMQWMIAAMVYLVLLLRLEVYAQLQHHLWAVFGPLFGCACLLRWALSLFWLIRLERRRSALLKGTYQLPPLQREPLSFEDRLPSIIKVRFNIIYGVMFFLAWSVALFAWVPGPSTSNPEIWQILIESTSLIVFFIFIAYVQWQSTIQITEHGLKKNVLKMAKTTEWSNAYLLLCYRLPNLIGRPKVIYYELSDQATRITWMWVVDAKSALAPWRPALPDELYQRQMRTLTELVQEKTGLPLYDLSEPWLKRKEEGTPKE